MEFYWVHTFMLLPTQALRVKAFTALSITSTPCCLTASAETNLKKFPRARTPLARTYTRQNNIKFFNSRMLKHNICKSYIPCHYQVRQLH